MKSILPASLGAAFVLLLFNMASWKLLPFHQVLRPVKDDVKFMDRIRPHVPETGAYYFPALVNPSEKEKLDAFHKNYEKGPVGILFVKNPGNVYNMGPTMSKAFFTYFLMSLVLAVLYWFAAPQLPSATAKVMFLAGVGIFAGLAGPVQNWNWFHHPLSWSVAWIFDYVVGNMLAGLLIIKFVRPESRTPDF